VVWHGDSDVPVASLRLERRTQFAGSKLEFLRTPRPATLQELSREVHCHIIRRGIPYSLNYSFPLTVGMDPAEPIQPGVLAIRFGD
jgi:hypothetical protein